MDDRMEIDVVGMCDETDRSTNIAFKRVELSLLPLVPNYMSKKKTEKERTKEKKQRKENDGSGFFAVLQISNSQLENCTTIRSSSFSVIIIIIVITIVVVIFALSMFECEGEWTGSQRLID